MIWGAGAAAEDQRTATAGICCDGGNYSAQAGVRTRPTAVVDSTQVRSIPTSLISDQEFPAIRDHYIAKWPTTTSFAVNLQLLILGMDMLFGSRLQEITSWGLATSATFTKADSSVSSIFYSLQMIHPMKPLVSQMTTNCSSPKCQNISYLVYFLPTTFVRLESPWSLIMINLPQGCRDAQFRTCYSHSLRPRDPGEVSFSCRGKQGAVLSLPIQAKRENTVTLDGFGKWMIKHIDQWFAWILDKELQIERMEDIVLITGTDHARSWANVAFLGGQSDARVSFCVEAAHSKVNWQFSPERKRGAAWNWGPCGEV